MKRIGTTGRHFLRGLILSLGLTALGSVALANGFPSKPVTMIVPYGAGGGTDTMGRVLAKALGKELGQPVVVVNRKGGGGAVGASFLKSTPPDGYTILMGGIDEIVSWIPHTKEVDYTRGDFRYLGSVANYQNALVAPSDQPFSNLKEFVAYARANPGTPVVTLGGMDRLFLDMVANRENLDLRMVPANGGGEIIKLLLGGNAVLAFSAGIHNNYEGKIKVIASLNRDRLTNWPEATTFIEEGYGVTMTSMIGFMTPAGVPDDVAAKLEATIAEAADSADFKKIVAARLKSDTNVLSATETTGQIEELEGKLGPLAKKM